LNTFTPSQLGYYFGGSTALVIFTVSCFVWGLKMFAKHRQTIAEIVVLLKDRNLENKRWAVKELQKFKWVPQNDDELIEYLKSDEGISLPAWDDFQLLGALNHSQKSDEILEILMDKGEVLQSRLLKKWIKLLGTGDKILFPNLIVPVLKKISGKDFGTDHNAWLKWYKSEWEKSSTDKP
jgi:hypothetical protein